MRWCIPSILSIVCLTLVSGERCKCGPSQYEAIINAKSGTGGGSTPKPGVTSMSMTLSFDYDKQMEAITENVNAGGRVIKVKVWMDFKKRLQYVLLPGGTCTQRPMSPIDILSHCIPENAVFLGQFYQNTEKNPFKVDMYSTSMALTGVTINATFAMASDTCFVVSEDVVTHTDATQSVTMSFITAYNATMGIKDPSVFNIPEPCLHASHKEPIPDAHKPLHHILTRGRRLML